MDREMQILEKEFSPSQWVKRFPTGKEAIDHHMSVIMAGTELARQILPCQLNIPWGNEPREKFDLYGTDLPDDAPIFVILHGGCWQMDEFTKELGTFGVIPLVQAGCRVVVADYEMCPFVTLSELVGRIHKCINFALCHAKLTKSKSISFLGHSAGAHLIISQFLMARFSNLTHKEFIKDVYLVSGVYDVRDLRFTEAVNSDNLLCIDETNLFTLSPGLWEYDHVTMEGTLFIRFTVVVADNDTPTYKHMATDMVDSLKKGGAIVNHEIIKDSDHFHIVEQLNDKNAHLTKLILKNLSD